MRAWHNILPLWKLKIPILVLNFEWLCAENTRTFTRRQQNILISICPVLYKCIKYQLSIHWNITKITRKSKQHTGVMGTGGGRSKQEHTESIPRFPWFPPQAGVRYSNGKKSDLLMVWIEKQLCFRREHSSSHLGLYCPSHALIFHGRRTGQELFQCFELNVVRHKSPAVVWETWKSLGKASRQLWQTCKVFLQEFFSFGCWVQHVEPAEGNPK